MTTIRPRFPRFRDLVLLFREIPFHHYILALLPIILYGLLFRLPFYLFICLPVLIERCWNRVYPWSAANISKRFIKQRQELLLQHARRSSSLDLDQLRRDASLSEPKDKFFGCLPPEIRRRILVYAFGERTVHIDVTYIPIIRPDEGGSVDASAVRIHGGVLRRFDDYRMHDGEWQWRWYGCVCHRSGPEDMTLSLGRFRNSHHISILRYTWSACLKGEAACHAWPGNQPDKCQLGCLGWLSTSKQAYIEGMEVVYGTNTINLSSSDIMLSTPNILPSNILRSISSLELVIDTQRSSLKYAFKNPEFSSPNLHAAPIFPNLLYLRISPVDWDIDISLKRDRWLHHHPEQWHQSKSANVSVTLQRIDSLLERIAPPTAEVTVDWDLTGYDTLSNQLLSEHQDQESLHMQECETGGRRYWRQIPTSIANIPTRDGKSLDSTNGASKRQGYWIYCNTAEDLD